MTIDTQPAAPDKERAEQTHYGKMVICNLSGGACLFAAGGFTGNFLLMGAGALQFVANGLLFASGDDMPLNPARRQQLRRLAYKLFVVNSTCSIAAGIGLGELANPFGMGEIRPEMIALGGFGLAGGLAGASKSEPEDDKRTKLIDLFRVNLPDGTTKPHWPKNLADLGKMNVLTRAGRKGWWQGLDSNKAASAWYMLSGGAPLVIGTVGLAGALIAGAPAAAVTAAVLSVGIGLGYTLGNFALAASKPKGHSPTPAPTALAA